MPQDPSALKLLPVSNHRLLTGFSCGNLQVDDFFNNKAFVDNKNGLSVTHGLFVEDNSLTIPLALATLKGSMLCVSRLKKKHWLGEVANIKEIPSVTLEFFGVQHDVQREGLGRIAIEKILKLLNSERKFGYRLLLVDALPEVKDFYTKTFFSPVDETQNLGMSTMYIDLLRLPEE